MAAVTVTAVQVRTLATTGEFKINPEFQLVVDDRTVVAISEFVNPTTKNVDNNYSVIYFGGVKYNLQAYFSRDASFISNDLILC